MDFFDANEIMRKGRLIMHPSWDGEEYIKITSGEFVGVTRSKVNGNYHQSSFSVSPWMLEDISWKEFKYES